ncbi:MAG TPA: 50S ribosomal protein L17 [Candidatus Saccharimonadales bacterium]|nr:50S ribosomal protein L17 [Candidatus Saccharimonadales bacterium]
MPHQVHQRKFGRETAHRKAMFRNLTLSILRYERVKTTEPKAKEVRRFVDGMILLGKDGSLAARRKAIAWLPEPEIVEKLFTDLAGRYPDRTSGFTRITRLGRRVGDSAPMMLIELMPGADLIKEQSDAEAAKAAPRRRLALPRRRAAATADTATAEKPATKAAAKKTVKKSTATKKAKA